MVKKFTFLLVIIFMVPALGYSQAVPMPAGPPPPPGLPIDNLIGVLFLISLGLIYGSRKILKDSSS